MLYTTHYMEEAESLCDRLAIIDHGHIIAHGSLTELRRLISDRDLLRLTGVFEPDAVRAAIGALPNLEIAQMDETTLLLAAADASHHLPAIFAALQSTGAEIREVNLTQSSLETLFIKMTGKQLRE